MKQTLDDLLIKATTEPGNIDLLCIDPDKKKKDVKSGLMTSEGEVGLPLKGVHVFVKMVDMVAEVGGVVGVVRGVVGDGGR